MLVITRIW